MLPLQPIMHARLFQAGLDATATAARAMETAVAANAVIARRLALMEAFCRAPTASGLAEMTRMVTEKAEASAQSGRALASGGLAVQADLAALMAEAGAAALRGLPPDPAEALRLFGRASAWWASAIIGGTAAWGAALAPVHRTATANARRLGAKPARRRRRRRA